MIPYLSTRFHPDFHNSQSKIQREMLQGVRDWVQSLGSNQHKVLSRLGKQAVRNHENIRLGGEGGAAAAEGTAAYNAGVNTQHDIQNYLHQQASHIPGFSQAQQVLGHFSPPAGPPPGMRRDMPGGDHTPAFPGAGPPSGPPPPSMPPPGATGEASNYYTGGSSTPHYAPPSGPQSSFPGGPQEPYGAPGHSGYTPSYASSPPPSFPGMPSMPGADTGGGYGGYGGGPGGFGPPAGPPPGPGGFGPPGGYSSPPPSFPQGGGGFPSPFAPPPGPPSGYPGYQNQGGY